MSDTRVVVHKGISRWGVSIDGVEVAEILKEYGGGGIHDFYYAMGFELAHDVESEVADKIGDFRRDAPDILRNKKEEVVEALKENVKDTNECIENLKWKLERLAELIKIWESY